MEEDDDYFPESIRLEFEKYDEEFGEFRTAKHENSLKPKQLFEKIKDDPSIEVFPTTEFSTDILLLFTPLIIVPVLVSIAYSLLTGVRASDMIPGVVFAGVIIMLCLFCCGFENRFSRVYCSPLGISSDWLNSYIGIEWKHVSYIRIRWRRNKEWILAFIGNRRHLRCSFARFGKRITLDVLRNYIPDFDSWKPIRKEIWWDDEIVYVRPEYYEDDTPP